jgi:hypothetical protein
LDADEARTKIVPHACGERLVLKLMYATVIRGPSMASHHRR